MFLSPYRMLCMGLKIDSLCHAKNDDGIGYFASWSMQLAKSADTLSLGMQFVLLVVALFAIIPLYALEAVFGTVLASWVVLVLIHVGVRKCTRVSKQKHV